jgi:hypothetical protein
MRKYLIFVFQIINSYKGAVRAKANHHQCSLNYLRETYIRIDFVHRNFNNFLQILGNGIQGCGRAQITVPSSLQSIDIRIEFPRELLRQLGMT